MRIISGKFKGLTLYAPKDKKIRPLKDMVRESIFNFLIHSNKISFKLKGANILDLYSGVGSFGLECLSRGATRVTFLESYQEVLTVLKKNIENLKQQNSSSIIEKDIFSENTLKTLNNKFDIIFMDPPYKEKKLAELLDTIIKLKLLKNNGIIIIHRHKKEEDEFPNQFNLIMKKKYGISKIIFGNYL